MKTIIFYLALVVIGFLIISKTTIHFKPFKISFQDLPYGLGWLFILLAVTCFSYSSYRNGNIDGYKEALNDVKVEFLKEKDASK